MSGPPTFSGRVFIGLSVDGFIARHDGDIDWLTSRGEHAGDAGFTPFVAGIDALVMGRGTYESIAPFPDWPYQGRPIHLLSATLAAEDDPRIAAVHRSVEEAVAALEAAGLTRVYVDGGQTIQAFLRAGLVDEITLSHVSVLIGQGHRLFGDLAADVDLEHVATEVLGGGMVQTTYRVPR